MYRLYVDEVGTDDLTHVDEDNHRYLSLTGIVMTTEHARDQLTSKFDWIKSKVFDHDPDDPIIFHRTHIVQRKGPFHLLINDEKKSLFDRSIMRAITYSEYKVITVMIDKKAMLRQEQWRNKHPYHYLLEILVEKYVQYLERVRAIGDIMPEGRKGIKDKLLQDAFYSVRAKGSFYVSAERMQAAIPSKSLKFRYKKDNISGHQLCDLLAHPSHMHVRKLQQHEVNPGEFCASIQKVLIDGKYDRSGHGVILGYGIKWLP